MNDRENTKGHSLWFSQAMSVDALLGTVRSLSPANAPAAALALLDLVPHKRFPEAVLHLRDLTVDDYRVAEEVMLRAPAKTTVFVAKAMQVLSPAGFELLRALTEHVPRASTLLRLHGFVPTLVPCVVENRSVKAALAHLVALDDANAVAACDLGVVPLLLAHAPERHLDLLTSLAHGDEDALTDHALLVRRTLRPLKDARARALLQRLGAQEEEEVEPASPGGENPGKRARMSA